MSEEQIESLNREIAEMADVCIQWEANYKSAENRAMKAGAKLREVEKQRNQLLEALKWCIPVLERDGYTPHADQYSAIIDEIEGSKT
jgi:hypothetical protein